MFKAIVEIFVRLFGRKKEGESPSVPEESSDDEVVQVVLDPPAKKEEVSPEPVEAVPEDEYARNLSEEPVEETSKEHGIELVLRHGDRGFNVKEFQKKLQTIGYELTRFGVDGHFGDETLAEVCDFQDDDRERGGTLKDEEHAIRLRGVGPKTFEAIEAEHDRLPKAPPPPRIDPTHKPDLSKDTPDEFYDLCSKDGQGLKSKRLRDKEWKYVVGITLHQTAVNMGNDPERYRNVSAHIAITPDGKIVRMNGEQWVVYHGNALNGSRGPGDIGIEISGAFSGIEGDLSTFWRPKSKPKRMPDSVTDAQIKAALNYIEYAVKLVKKNGGQIRYIHAHRQSSKSRVSDPGSKVWQKIALVAKRKFNLEDGGPDWTVGGYPIPKDWDPSYTVKYR